METEWRSVVSHAVESMTQDGQDVVFTYKPEADFKIKAAVIEAAKRLSFREPVCIACGDSVLDCCR